MLGTMGSERVWDFTAIGTGVNLAAHLMEHARDGRRLLVDKVTFRSARELVDTFEGPESFDLRKPGQTVAHPYERYRLVRRKGRPVEPEVAAPPVHRGGLFISYSRKDDAWRQMLRTHLQPYVTAGSVEVWDDTAVEAGDWWEQTTDNAMERAAVALFLVTPHLLASPFILKEEITPLLARARARDVRILWLPVSASSYEETEFSSIQAALNPVTPLDQMPAPLQHHALVDLCKIIKASLGSRTAG